MDELVKALRHFISRDLLYLIGGGAAIAAFLHLFGRLPKSNDHVVTFLLLGGVSYFVGYALQELACLTGAVTTAMPHRLGTFRSWLYRRLQKEAWTDIPDTVDLVNREWSVPDDHKIQLERIVTLNQVGTTGFPCALLSAGLFLVEESGRGSASTSA